MPIRVTRILDNGTHISYFSYCEKVTCAEKFAEWLEIPEEEKDYFVSELMKIYRRGGEFTCCRGKILVEQLE